MKKLTFLLLSLLVVMPAMAQITHTSKGAVDQNAEKVIKRAAQKFKGDAVSFTVTMVNKDANKKETARQQAEVLYHQGKYRVSFGENVIYCDGKSTWHWNKEANEVVVNSMSSSDDDLMNPAALLANYSKNFRAKFIREEKGGTSVVDLTPIKSMSYYKIRLLIQTSTGLLQSMEMHNYDGSEGDYRVSNFKSGVKAAASSFSFQKTDHPKVEVIDMR